jgi:hypothetical protein
VLSEEMLDDIRARLEHSPHKSLARSAKQVHVMRTTVWRATKRLNLWPYKITKVHAIEEGASEHFCNWFCGQYMTVFLTQNLHFSVMKLGSI